MRYYYVVVAFCYAFALLSCQEDYMPPPNRARSDDSLVIGTDGKPVPPAGWEVMERYGWLDNGMYFNTGGDWYIIIHYDAIELDSYTQLYMHPDPNQPDVYSWRKIKQYRQSEHYVYIDDPSKAYFRSYYLLYILK